MKKKWFLTRRQRALRRLAPLACLLLVSLAALLADRGYTPAHARRDSEDREGMGATHVVEELDLSLGEDLTLRAVLSENRRGILFSLAGWDWLRGWQAVDEYGVAWAGQDLGSTGGQALYGGTVTLYNGSNRGENRVLLFFHVDPGIFRVEIEGKAFLNGEGERGAVRTVWERQGEETVCLLLPHWDGVSSVGSLRCVGYDAQGSEVCFTWMDRSNMILTKTGIGGRV